MHLILEFIYFNLMLITNCANFCHPLYEKVFISIKSWPSLKLGHVESNTKVTESSLRTNLENTLGDIVLIQSSWNFVRIFISIKARPNLKPYHVWLKLDRSLSKLRTSIHSRGYRFCTGFMKLCPNVYLHNYLG